MATLGSISVWDICIYLKRINRLLLPTIQMGHFVSVLFKHYKCSYRNVWKHIMKTEYMFSGWLLIGSDYKSAKVWYASPQQFWPTLIDWSIHTMGQNNYNYPLKKYHFGSFSLKKNHSESIYWPSTNKHLRICVKPSLHHYNFLVYQETLISVRSVLSLAQKMQMVLYRQKCEQFMDSKLI